MSEIKGQLLGIILVLMVFGAISVAVVTIFNNLVDKTAQRAEDAVDTSSTSGAYRISNFISY